MGLLEELRVLGVNVEDALERLGGDEEFYKKMLAIFVDTIEMYYVDTKFNENDYEKIIEKAHAIKGASGNLSITPLYEAYTKIVDELRKKNLQSAREEIERILPMQKKIISCIQKYM